MEQNSNILIYLKNKLYKYKNKYINLKTQCGGTLSCKDLVDNELGFNNRFGTCWNIAIQTIFFYNKLFGSFVQQKLLDNSPQQLLDGSRINLELFLPNKLLDRDNKLLPNTEASLIKIITELKNRFDIKYKDFKINNQTPKPPKLERDSSILCEKTFVVELFNLFGINERENKLFGGGDKEDYFLLNMLSIILLDKFVEIKKITKIENTGFGILLVIINKNVRDTNHAIGIFNCSDDSIKIVDDNNIYNLTNMDELSGYTISSKLYYDTGKINIRENKTSSEQSKIDIDNIKSLHLHDIDLELLYQNRSYYSIIDPNYIHSFMSKINKLNQKFKLFEAIEKKDKESINTLLQDQKLDINVVDKNSNTAIHRAIITKDIDIISMILTREPELIDTVNNKNESPLIDAIKSDNIDILNLILKLNPDINKVNISYETPLMYAIKTQNLPIINRLLDVGTKIDTVDIKKESALIYAIKTQNLPIINRLLDMGAKIDAVDINNESALMYAIKTQNLVIINRILDTKIVINEENDKFLSRAIITKNKDIVKIILDKYSDIDKYKGHPLLLLAIEENNKDIIKMILERTKNIDVVDNEGNTSLLLVVKSKDKKIIELILTKNPDINKEDENDKTPLIYAIETKDKKIIELILTKNPDINKEDKNGKTPLMYAIETKNKEIIELILKAEAKPEIDKEDEEGNTLLMYAIKTKDKEIIELILKAIPELKIDKANNEGYTPLMYAIKTRNLDIVNLILGKNPNLNLQTDIEGDDEESEDEEINNESALMFAIETKNINIIKALLIKDQNFNLKNNEGDNAMIYAIRTNNEEIIKLVLEKYPLLKINKRIQSELEDLNKLEDYNPNIRELFKK